MKIDPKIYDKFRSVDRIDDAARLLSTLRGMVEGHPNADFDTCRKTLQERPFMYYMLHEAFLLENLHRLEDSSLLSDHPRKQHWRDRVHCSQTVQLLDKLKTIFATACCAKSFPVVGVWINESSSDASIRAHSASVAIPKVPWSRLDRPIMPLYNLGGFKADGTLTARIRSIFRPSGHTFLVNVSASGKTKLLYEGLCQYWGLFFTCHVDEGSLGSSDVQRAVGEFTALGWSPLVDTTIAVSREVEQDCIDACVHRLFSKILLGRLLQLKLFLEVAVSVENQDDAKRIWLCYQIQEDLVGVDVGQPILNVLSSMERWHADNAFIDDAIHATLTELFSVWPSITSEPLFIALDEANAGRGAVGKYNSHPILKDILRVWHTHVKDFNVSFVVAGTDISRTHFNCDDPEWSAYKRSSNTGDFLEDPARHKAYIEGLLPPKLRNRPSGISLVRRMVRWLPGRYRYTAVFISELFRHNFRKPHQCLNVFLADFTRGFHPRDEKRMYEKGDESEIDLSRLANVSLFDATSCARATLHDALVNCLLNRDHPLTFGSERTSLVSEGFAHFIDLDSETVAIDEPITLLGGTSWFVSKFKSISDLAFYLDPKFLPYRTTSCTLSMIALSLSHAWSSSRRLSEMFSFPGSVPTWADQHARLITLMQSKPRAEPERYFYDYIPGTLVPLCTFSDSPSGVGTWMSQQETTVFCIHTASALPKLLFMLELEDESTIWVAIQVDIEKYEDDRLPLSAVRRLLDQLRPSQIFAEPEVSPIPRRVTRSSTRGTTRAAPSDALKKLPGRRDDLGEFSLLRVAAPMYAKALGLEELDASDDSSPFAIINIEAIDAISAETWYYDIQDDVAASLARMSYIQDRERRF
ncbi:hypothetical protein BDZ89DRAFT_1081644, partial [Hymenopellis radicata]